MSDNIIFITDLHFGSRNDSKILDNYFRKFYDEVFFPYVDEHHIKTVVDLGDTFDRRKYISFKSFATCKEYWFDALEKRGIDVHVLTGNHDAPWKNTLDDNSPRLLLKGYDNITVYDKPTDVEINGLTIGMLPWICTDNFQESMKYLDNTKANYICSHLDIAGFEMHRGVVSDHGFDRKMFRKFDKIFSGHFHTRSDEDNIKYLGAPYEMTWADYNDPRGFHVFNTKTKEIKPIDNPLHIFHKIYYDDRYSELDDLLNLVLDYKDSYVKVIVQNKVNPYWFDLFLEKIEKTSPIDIKIVETGFMVDEDDDISMEEMEDTSALIRKYCHQVDTEYTKELEKCMLSLYSDAQEIE